MKQTNKPVRVAMLFSTIFARPPRFARFTIAALLLLGIFGVAHTTIPVHAQDADFSNGITVDSTLDTPDTNIGDGICDDGAGNCTLRAAIEEANSNADASTINFNITGTPDFTNNSQNGYTIKPQSVLPDITNQLTIDGYTQPGSQANTAVAPNPLNGTLLIELDGSEAGAYKVFKFINNSDNSTVKGLVINDFGSGDAFMVLADGLKVQGNYIGTDPTGSTAEPNRVALTANVQDTESGHDALIGGLDPSDRNLISGNTDNSDNLGAATAGYPGTGWIIQGNYVGVGADGLSPIPNGIASGSGAFSIDECQDVLIGGSQEGAINVIGTNYGHGIAPGDADNVSIIGNYIGLGYDGMTVIDNGLPGITGSGVTVSLSSGVTISNNKIAGWSGGGIYLGADSLNFTISGNEIYSNDHGGIDVQGNQINVINNKIYDNSYQNVQIGSYSPVNQSSGNISFRGNQVGIRPDSTPGVNNGVGIKIYGDPTNVIIGGTSPADGNVIAYNKQGGIIVSSFSVIPLQIALDIQKVSILGNSIHNNEPDTSGPFTVGGLGIDLYTDIDEDGNFSVDTASNTGPTPNDSGDSDTGPNNFINFPVLNSVSQTGDQATINFNLDAADSPADQYRVEFFANDEADPSGYGEGQTYLGFATVSNGTNQQTSFTLPTGTNLAGKYISATTTALDSTTFSGFGATSEFSAVKLASVVNLNRDNTGSLASTGTNLSMIIALSVALVASAGITLLIQSPKNL